MIFTVIVDCDPSRAQKNIACQRVKYSESLHKSRRSNPKLGHRRPASRPPGARHGPTWPRAGPMVQARPWALWAQSWPKRPKIRPKIGPKRKPPRTSTTQTDARGHVQAHTGSANEQTVCICMKRPQSDSVCHSWQGFRHDGGHPQRSRP